MKKMWKRFVSLLLACTLLAGMLPLSASAQATEPTETEWIKNIISDLTKDSYDLQAKTQLGESDVWMYIYYKSYWDGEAQESVNDTVFIFQPGQDAASTEIPNYDNVSAGQPWSLAKPSAIYIAEGVTGIGNYAFASQPSLNNVVFQDASDLTYIGQRAFYDDDNAVFTDEGNEDKTTTLDLSNVKKMGEYAFYNCDKLTGVELGGSITAVETVEGEVKETEYKIPSHAFTSTGVQSITVPSGIKKVGEYAFYDCPLNKEPYISLQEGLETIGNYAFGKNDAAPNTAMSSLTIPSSVESIGDHAFYNYTGLQTVTVLGKDNGGAGASALTHVGGAAFGDADHNAYSTTTTIQDAVHPEIEYTGLVGTQFYLPKELEKNDKLFVNGDTCYTGDITPMQYVNTEPADCINAGYDIYKTTFTGAASGGKPIVMTYHYPIPALGHDYGEIRKVERTCEHDNYFVQYCLRDNCPNKGSAVGSLRQNQEGPGLFDKDTNKPLSDEELDEYREQFEKAEGHNWKVKSVVNPNMQEGQATTLYYVCENEEHRNGLDTYDSPFDIPLSGKTIHALTTQSLNDLTNQLAGFSNDGTVEWATPSNEKFGKEGERNEPVTFTIQTDVNQEWPVFTEAPVGEPEEATGNNEKLTVKINVTKDVLDLSGVSIVPNTANVGKPVNVQVSGFEEANKKDSVEYYVVNKWQSEQPKTEGKYKVRVTFEYDKDMYNLPEKGSPEYPSKGYTLVQEEDSVWVEHPFEVSLNRINAVAEPIFNLTYNEKEQNTLRIVGLEIGQKAVVTATGKDGKETTWEYIGKKDDQTTPVEGLPLLSAGTYNVKVVFSFPGEDTYADKEQELTVHIDHKPVEKPVPTQNMSYLPVKTARDAFEGQTSTDWEFVDNETYTHTGINAGSYTAKVKLTNENYRWADENEDEREIEIPWTISPRQIVAPTLGQNYYIYQYGTWRNPLFLAAAAHPNYEFVTNEEDHTVKLVYIGNKDTDDYDQEAAVAYTAANAYHTNRGRYPVTVTLNESENYVWHGGNAPSDLTWTIAPATLTLPTIEAEDADYTGKPYDAGSLVTVEDGGVTLPGDVKKAEYQYSHDTTFRSPSNNAPINAGTYFVRQNYTYDTQNYNAQIPYASFTINKATAKMTFDRKEVSAPYTAEGTDLQQVTVDGLVDADESKPASDVYTVTYTYKYRNDNTDWEEVKTETTIEEPNNFKFTNVGEYQITATFSSQNYTAAPAIYTLTITQADEQKITLTSADANEGTWELTEKTYTTIYGSEKTFTVTGTAALDNASISYAVNGDSNVVSVDGSSGVVTIHKAGTATITVTAAETPNVGAASVDYTVTVKKATPTVNTGLEGDELTVAYTGKAIEGYDKATPAANVVEGAAKPTGDITYTFYTDQECKNKVTNGGGEENNIPIAVGTYYMKATYPGDKNYLPAESKVVTVTVTKAQLTVDAEGHTGTYDGKTHDAITVNSVTGNSEEITGYTVKYAVTNNDTAPNENAGEEVWKGTLPVKDVADSTSENLYYWYMVTADNYNPAIGEVEVKIAPAPLTVAGEPTHYTKEYDGDKTVDETFDEITVTAKDVPEVTIDVDATGTYDNENAGEGKNVTLTLTLSGTDGTEIDWDNYSYNGAAPTDGKITLTKDDAGTITPKAITVTGISAENRVYDGTEVVQLMGEPKTTDKVGEDNLTLALASNATGSIESADVGNDKAVTVETSVITLGGTDANNYKVSAVKDAANGDVKVNITQRPVNLEFAGIGQDDRIIEKAYTGQPVNVTVGPVNDSQPNTGFVKGDTLNAGDVVYTYSPEGHTAVGSYTVTAALKENPTGNYDNYQLNFPEKATLKITPAEMVVTAEDYTSTYTGKAHDVTASWTANTTDSASTKIDITKVEFIKKTDDDTRPEADAEGWSEISFTNVADSGEYWYKVTAQNYAPMVGEEAVTITINPATLTITRTVTPTKTYDGTVDATNQVTGYSASGVDGETIEITNVSASYDDANAGTGKTITITYTLSTKANLGNYKYGSATLSGTNATVTETVTKIDETQVGIAPAEITVTIKDQQKVYDGVTVSGISNPEQDKDWSTTGTIYSQNGTNKDDLDITLTVDDAKKAGTYAITGTASNQNYEVTFTGSWTGEDANNGHAGTYTISPRPIDVQIGNAEGFYGDAPVLTGVGLTYEANDDNRGLAPDEENVPGIKLGTGANEQSPVAVVGYTIYAVNDDNQVALNTPTVIGNYKVTFTKNGTYTVNPRPITITIEDKKSDYGCDIAQLTYNGTLSNTYTGSNKNVVFVGDDEDELGITLSTTAKKGSDAGTYPISGEAKAESSVVSNYAITWKGENPFIGEGEPDSTKATYTVEKADLDVEFTNETVNISMGGQVENPLKYINASNGNEDLSAKPDGVTVTYSSSDPSVAEVNSSTGEVTLAGVGDATITANVTDGGKNFNSGASDTYVIHVAQDGGLRTTVRPVAGLTYTGEMQNLVTYTTSPEGATVTFTVTAQESGDQCQIDLSTGIPQALDAGTYTVSWRTTLEGYREETGSITVTVAKADPSKGFTSDSVSVAYEENKIYDSTEDTILQVEVGYASEAGNSITYLSDDTQVARVEDNNLETILLNSMGTAHISARFAETENFQEQTVFFTLTVGQATTMINYTAEDYKVTYDGQAHGSRITVTSPSEYTIKYSDNQGASYDLDESPAITDAGSRTIYFQIQADGYQSAIGTQTVTVEPKPIKENMIAGIAESYTYTGKGITFDDAISVHDEGVLLKQNTDYTIDYGDNKEVGTGFVTITGMGNYTGEVIEHFDIIPVDGSSGMTASIDPAYGTYDPDGNTATVTVTHQTGSGSHDVDLTAANAKYTISATDLVTGQAITDHGATGTGNTLTFTKPAIYDITLKLTGDHQGEFHLSYTLLPLSNEDGGLTLTVDDETQKVFTYGGEIDPSDATIKVTANNTDVTDQCTLTYVYTPFEGTPTTTASPYTAEVLENAGVYTVTATPTDGSAITGTGTFTFLILQRDLSKAILDVNDTDLVFNHDEKKPDVTVAVTGDPTADDYTVAYYNNVNASKEAKAVVTAKGNNFTGSQTAEFTIAPKEITADMVQDIPDQYYTGKEVVPPVTIKDSSYTLILGYDYTTACDAIGPGTATVTITGTGNYTETTTKDFVIKSEGAPEPSERFDLAVTPSQWIWKDDLTNLRLSVTFGTGNELDLGTEYTLSINNEVYGDAAGETKEQAIEAIKSLKPGTYTITATGTNAYKDSKDTETVTVKKIQPELTVTAAPETLSGGGKVTLTLKGEKLPAFAEGQDLSSLLTASAKDEKNAPDLSELEWETDEQTGVMTAELTLPNTSETYTFTLTFTGNEYYEAATASEQVVVAQQIISGGGGGPVEDQPADPDDTGVSDWLNTKDHLAYLAGYPGGTFGPDQNMTRAEAAQMFYNLLLEKDVEITVEFEDVPADAWYAKPVNTLASLGILSGVGNGRFDPERSITRAEFTVIAMKFANTSGGGVNIFSDVNEDDWFYSAVVDSTQYGWINGYPDGTFRPEATISRAEVTVIVNHMLGRAADRPYVIAHEEELNTFGDVNRGHWGYFHVAEATNAHEYHTEDGTESWTGLS